MKMKMKGQLGLLFVVLMSLLPWANGYAYHKDNSGLTEVPGDIPAEILTVYLSWNNIKDIKPGAFSQQNWCRWMWLNDNKLTEVREDMWEGLNSLLELYLFNNKIATLQPGAFKPLRNVQALWLWQNEIGEIRGDIWEGLGSLKRLYLENNRIASIKSGGFTTLPNLADLEYLGLIDNRLTTMRDDIFTSSGTSGSDNRPANLTLILSDNPFQCDSRLCWLKTAEQDGWINFYYFYSRMSPECVNLPGISWEEIRMDCE